MNLESFEKAFDTGFNAAYSECACGKTYVDTLNPWDISDESIESMVASGAIPVGYAVSSINFEGQHFVLDCTCWHERAEKVMRFLDAHAAGIGAYFENERKRLTDKANNLPRISEVKA